MTSSYSLSQGTGLRPAWLFGSFRMCLFRIFYETSLCLFFSLRVSIPLLQVITSSSKLIPGQSSIELQNTLFQPWRDSSSGCLCIFLNLRRQQLRMAISGTALLVSLAVGCCPLLGVRLLEGCTTYDLQNMTVEGLTLLKMITWSPWTVTCPLLLFLASLSSNMLMT